MRNLFPLAAIGCVTVIIIGIIVGGIVMIGYGVGDLFKKDKSKQQVTVTTPQVAPSPRETMNLQTARADVRTILIDSNFQRGPALPKIPQTRTIYYKSPGGQMAALISDSPNIGPRRPLIVWVHDGFGGINSEEWDLARPFQDRHNVVMMPTFREETPDNGGRFEMFYGEVDDLFAAIEHGTSQPQVDPNRVYVVGHGTGGTLALLAAVSGRSKPAVRAWFAIGGTPQLEEVLKAPESRIASTDPPFERGERELRLRSALPFASFIRQPTFYFGAPAIDPVGCNQAMRMESVASGPGEPSRFRAFLIPRATNAKFVGPVVDLIGRKIDNDRFGVTIRFDPAEINQYFGK